MERFLSDEHSAIAIELVGSGADYLTMRRGRWFEAGLPTSPDAPYDASLRAAEIALNQARWTANVELADDEEIPTDGLVAASASDIADLVERYFVGWPWPRADQTTWGRINGITFRNQQHLHAVPLADTGDVDAVRRLAAALREEAQRRWAAPRTTRSCRFDATEARTAELHAVFADMLQRVGATTAEWWPLGERAVALVEVQAEDQAQASALGRALGAGRPAGRHPPARGTGGLAKLPVRRRPRRRQPAADVPGRSAPCGDAQPAPESRVRIATELLDDGADASYESGPGSDAREGAVNALHLLFDAPTHDFELEAELLERLLDGGADINLRDHQLGTPLRRLLENAALDDGAGPFDDVLLARQDLDFEYVVTRIGDRPVTLREIIDRGGRPAGPPAERLLRGQVPLIVATVFPDMANRDVAVLEAVATLRMTDVRLVVSSGPR